MITEYMTLTTKADAHTWAQTYNLTTEQTDLLTHWIWTKKPGSGCTFAEHPLSSISDDDFYELVEA